jgi:hypothetical protein
VQALADGFIRLEKASARLADNAFIDNPQNPQGKNKELQQEINDAKNDLVRTASDLIGDLNFGLHQRIAASRRQNTVTLAMLVSTASLSMLLVLPLDCHAHSQPGNGREPDRQGRFRASPGNP